MRTDTYNPDADDDAGLGLFTVIEDGHDRTGRYFECIQSSIDAALVALNEYVATIVFGSVLKGSPTFVLDRPDDPSGSDIDLCILTPKDQVSTALVEEIIEEHLGWLVARGVPVHLTYYRDGLQPAVKAEIDRIIEEYGVDYFASGL